MGDSGAVWIQSTTSVFTPHRAASFSTWSAVSLTSASTLVKEQLLSCVSAGPFLSSSSCFSSGACDEENVVSPHQNLESFPFWSAFHCRIAVCPQLHQFTDQSGHKLVPALWRPGTSLSGAHFQVDRGTLHVTQAGRQRRFRFSLSHGGR